MNTGSVSWYALRTVPGKEIEAKLLMEKKIDCKLWNSCRILKKQQLFRTRGKYLLCRKDLFPGYIFIETGFPAQLADELQKARQFPQMTGNGRSDFVPIEPEDLRFLENVCGRELIHDMLLSTVCVDKEGRVKSAEGALKPYLGRITRQRLRHRYVTAEVPLFDRVEKILFGIRMEGDPA